MKKGFIFYTIFVGLLVAPHGTHAESTAHSKVVSSEKDPIKEPPFYDQIIRIIDSLEYSGFQVLIKPEVTLSIDFEKKTWTLHKVHHYDSKGEILLEQGRYGLCAELATYLYERLGVFLSKQYDVKFAMTTEEGFFPTYQSNHIILLMHDRLTQNMYLMDPSFHKYEDVRHSKGYQIMGVQDALAFVREKSQDVSFRVDEAMPLFIKDEVLASFTVTSADGKFDKNNYLLLVSVSRRNKIEGLNIVMVGKYDNKIESYEGKDYLESLLNRQDIDNLHKKLITWIKQI